LRSLLKDFFSSFILLVAVLFLTLNACSDGDEPVDHSLELRRYNWMVGNWNSTTDPAIWEFWKLDSTELRGLSIEIKGKDSNILEEMRILWKDSGFVFIADVAENKEPVEFFLVKKEANRLRFQNKLHDFPKEISYQKIGHNSLRATIGGKNKSIKFLFVKR